MFFNRRMQKLLHYGGKLFILSFKGIRLYWVTV